MAGEVSSVWNLAPKRKEKVKLMHFSKGTIDKPPKNENTKN